eukprot:SAG31_NODE_271_length_18717_cov_8.685949_15_plen_55_part_00
MVNGSVSVTIRKSPLVARTNASVIPEVARQGQGRGARTTEAFTTKCSLVREKYG